MDAGNSDGVDEDSMPLQQLADMRNAQLAMPKNDEAIEQPAPSTAEDAASQSALAVPAAKSAAVDREANDQPQSSAVDREAVDRPQSSAVDREAVHQPQSSAVDRETVGWPHSSAVDREAGDRPQSSAVDQPSSAPALDQPLSLPASATAGAASAGRRQRHGMLLRSRCTTVSSADQQLCASQSVNHQCL